MKKIVSFIMASSLVTGIAMADENGAFVGVQIGNGYGIDVGYKGASVAETTSIYGAKVGYQGLFSNESNQGLRVYFSALVGVNAKGFTEYSPSINGVSTLTFLDINGDYLLDFVTNETYSIGMYAGLFTGALIVNANPITSLSSTNPSYPRTTAGISAGFNVGARITLEKYHQFEVGLKFAMAYFYENRIRYVANDNTDISGGSHLSLFPLINIGYNYKF